MAWIGMDMHVRRTGRDREEAGRPGTARTRLEGVAEALHTRAETLERRKPPGSASSQAQGDT